jgi:hypothetical protein
VYCYPPKTDVSFPTNADPFNGIEVAHFLTIALEEFDKVEKVAHDSSSIAFENHGPRSVATIYISVSDSISFFGYS